MDNILIYKALKLIENDISVSLPILLTNEGSGYNRIKNLGYITIKKKRKLILASLTQSGKRYILNYEAHNA